MSDLAFSTYFKAEESQQSRLHLFQNSYNPSIYVKEMSTQRSTLGPPNYYPLAAPTAVSTSSIPSMGAQAAANREKQAIRDHQQQQDNMREGLHDVSISPIPYNGPRSIEPSSNGSDAAQGNGNGYEPPVEINGGRQTDDGEHQQYGNGHLNTKPSQSSGSQDGVLGHRGLLPEGMDVQQALQQCEDPTLGWSLQFWVTIADPVTQHVFFANPASGQCSWEPPVGSFIVPRSAEGEWWELADASRGNRSYYYNTLSGRTQWTRPANDAFVIPLGLIQNKTLPKRSNGTGKGSGTPTRATFSAAPQHSPSNSNRSPRDGDSPHRSRQSAKHLSPSTSAPSKLNHSISPLQSTYSSQTADSNQRSLRLAPPLQDHLPSVKERPLSEMTVPNDPSTSTYQRTAIVPNPTAESLHPHSPVSPIGSRFRGAGGKEDGETSDTGSDGSWWERRRILAVKKLSPRLRSGSPIRSPTEQSLKSKASPLRQNSAIVHEGNPSSPLRDSTTTEHPLYVQPSVKTKRFSTGPHPLLPPDISNDITAFQNSSFATKFFATKRTGLLRSKIPIEQILTHQTSPIASPILTIPRHFNKDAVTTFKVIQHVMGDRARPVEGASMRQSRTDGGGSGGGMTSSQSALSMVTLGQGRKGDQGDVRRGGRLANGFSHSTVQIDGDGNLNENAEENGKRDKVVNETSQKMVVLEEIRWLLLIAVTNIEMRDEVYAQLIKQLTRNPDHESVVLGFQLFCVFVLAFGPSKDFTTFVRNFLKLNKDREDDGIGIMAKYCLVKLEILANKGGRGKSLTIGEIEHASDAAFYPSIYGESLETIMSLQERSYPDLKVPIVLPFLADGILALGGMSAEGIFRVPGDNDSIFELKSRIDRGHYQLNGISDPHVAASLFKLWLRELESPIVPVELYNDALVASRSPEECVKFVSRLPTYNRRVLLFVISFFQLFISEEVLKVTKMTVQNLALVLAPNILRTTSDSLVTVFTNSTFESKFTLQLLQNVRPDQVDRDYVPVHGQPLERESMETMTSRGGF